MKKLISFIVSLLLITTLCSFTSVNSNSEVLNDLRKDSNFNINDYPSVSGDYSVQLINIAESIDDNLILYVYQPSNDTVDLKAKSVSLDTKFSKDGQDINPSLYPLQLLSTDGVFDKYKVLNFKVSGEVERFYNIVSLYREVKYEIDKDIVGGITNEKAYAVGEQWCAYDKDDTVIYEMNTFETLEITTNHIGNIRFNKGINIGSLVGMYQKGDLHYISFSSESYVIDHIYDGDISFKSQSKTNESLDGVIKDPVYGPEESHTITLTEHDKAEFNTDGFFGLFSKTYKWNRISRSSDFISNMQSQGIKFNQESLDNINKGNFVFAFYETKFEHYTYPNGFQQISTKIKDVSILRLHFMDTTGKQYNLGVVNDKVSGDSIVDGAGSGIDIEKAKLIFGIVLGLIGLALLLSLLGLVVPLFKGLWTLIKFIFKVIVNVITYPFKLIIRLFKGNKE